MNNRRFSGKICCINNSKLNIRAKTNVGRVNYLWPYTYLGTEVCSWPGVPLGVINCSWTGNAKDRQWTVAGNWSMARVPTKNDMIYIKNNNNCLGYNVEINTEGSVYGYMLKMIGKSTLVITKGTLEINDLCMSKYNANKINIMQGSILLSGNIESKMSSYVESGRMVAYGGAGTVLVSYMSNINKTLLSAAPRPAPLLNFPVYSTITVSCTGSTDCTTAIQNALNAAASTNKPAEVFIPSGTYYINATKGSALSLNKKQNIILTGDPSLNTNIIINNPTVGFLGIRECSNIIVKNINIDYNPLPFTQGIITSVQKGSVNVQISAGFPSLNEDYFLQAPQKYGLLMDPNIPGKQKDNSNNAYTIKTWTGLGGNVFKIESLTLPKSAAVGDGYVQMARYNEPINDIRSSSNITFMNFTIYTGPGGSYSNLDNTLMNFVNCKTILKAGRWHTTDGDGLFSSANRIGPWIQNCQWQSVGDDNIIIKTEALQCSQKISSTQYVLQLAASDNSRTLNIVKGDIFNILDPVSGTPLDQAMVTNVSINKSAVPVTYTITFNKALNSAISPGLTANAPYWYDDGITSSNFLIQNCSITSPRRFGMFILGHTGLIQNCTLTYTEPEAMALHQDLFVNGFVPSSLMIIYNTFNNDYVQDVESTPSYGNPAIVVAYTMTTKGISAWEGITNIVFQNNTFNNLSKVEAMYLSSINGMTVINNTFNSVKTTGLQVIASILNANNISFTNNMIKGTNVSATGSINVQPTSTTNITVANNTFV